MCSKIKTNTNGVQTKNAVTKTEHYQTANLKGRNVPNKLKHHLYKSKLVIYKLDAF